MKRLKAKRQLTRGSVTIPPGGEYEVPDGVAKIHLDNDWAEPVKASKKKASKKAGPSKTKASKK